MAAPPMTNDTFNINKTQDLCPEDGALPESSNASAL